MAVAIGFMRYSGSTVAFLLFNACFVALAAAIFPRPRLYAYTILTVLLLLGLWAKTLMHTIWSLEFVEPAGGFGGTPAEWDAALLAMSAAAIGVLAARLMHLAWRRWRAAATWSASAPAWYPRYRTALWILTVAGIVVVNAANLQFAFFQIGINMKLLLPLRLHVVAAWLINIGFAVWIAALLWWDYLARPASLVRNVGVAFSEAFLSPTSALSRLGYLVHATPYWLALWEERARIANALTRRRIAILVALFMAFFIASVFTVFVLRAKFYPDNADLARNIRLEIPQLIVGRWIGLEGVLAVGAVPGRDLGLLAQAVADSPKAGTESMYQRAAGTRYKADEARRFIFLTNAGPVALLLFSGSLVVVGLGMALLTLALLGTEEAAARWTGNPFLLAVSAAGLANVLCQTTFFYLTLIFALQMWVAIVVIGALSRLGR